MRLAALPFAIVLALLLLTAGPILLPAGGLPGTGTAFATSSEDEDDDCDDDDDDDDDDDEEDEGDDDDCEEDLPEEAEDQILTGPISEAMASVLRAAGYTILRQSETLTLIGLPEGVTVPEALDFLARISPNAVSAPNSFYRNQQGAAACTAEICALWSQAGWSQAPQCVFSPLIGIVDTGVNASHEMLVGAAITLERAAVAAPSDLVHGTAILAMLAGRSDSRVPGLLPDARFHVVDPFTLDVNGDERTDAFALVDAIDVLVSSGVDVINLSLAGPANPLLEAAIGRAIAAGIPVVAASGNAGPLSPPLYPAGYEAVVAVSAVDATNAIYRRAVQGPQIDFVAPGVAVPTAASVSGIRPQTGTSFAVPFVTAALAVEKALDPALDPAALTALLAARATDLGDPGRDAVFGFGLVQLGDPCPAS